MIHLPHQSIYGNGIDKSNMSLSQPIHNIGSHPSTMSDPISIPEEKKSNPDPVQDDANNSKDIESSSNPVNENVVVFPDGGSAAWLQVVGGFILMFDTW